MLLLMLTLLSPEKATYLKSLKIKFCNNFVSAIKSKVTKIAEEIEADYNNKFEAEAKTAKDELVEKVDSYLNYVVEEWMKENELALERGIKRNR